MFKYAGAAIASAIFGGPDQPKKDPLYNSDEFKERMAIEDKDNMLYDHDSDYPQTLKEGAEGTGMYIGTAVNYRMLKSDLAYSEIPPIEYDLVAPENMCKMNFIAKSFTDLDYSKCNYVRDYAKENGMAMRFHNLIWGSPGTHNPSFVRNERSPHKLEAFMNSYIEKVMTNVGDYPFAWDVVNEAVTDGYKGVMKTSPWSIVPDYVCKAFKKAKEMNPKAELFYNDYKHASMEGRYKMKSDKVYNFVKDLKDRGCGVDGVGFQSHVDINYADENYDSIRKNIQRYAAIGVKVHMTEVDVRCNQPYKGSSGNCPFWKWPQSALDKQAHVYSNLLKVCLEEPNCYSFSTWGFSDRRSSMQAPQNPLVMDKNFNKKSAYDDMLEVLYNFDKESPAALERMHGDA